ncbi:Group-specific protein [Balamuthia mandrillaris]
MDKKKFFEQQIDAQKPKPIKKEVVWTPSAGQQGTGAHTSTGYRTQTKKQLNLGPPPEKKSLSDLP